MMRWIALAALLAASPAYSQAVVVATCGSKTFAVGSQNYVTMNTLGYLCVSTTTTVVVTTAAQERAAVDDAKKREEK